MKDAFLTVRQEVPTRVVLMEAAGNRVTYSLGRVLLGQRDGSLCGTKILLGLLKSVQWRWKNARLTPAFCAARQVIASS